MYYIKKLTCSQINPIEVLNTLRMRPLIIDKLRAKELEIFGGGDVGV